VRKKGGSPPRGKIRRKGFLGEGPIEKNSFWEREPEQGVFRTNERTGVCQKS